MIQERNVSITPARTGISWALSCLFVALFALIGSAGGGDGDGGPVPPGSNPNNWSSPDDEVASLPIVQGSTGMTFVGPLDQLRTLHASVHGRGRVEIVELPSGEFAVTVAGNVSVELDRAALARSDIDVFFRGGARFVGGVGRLQILDGRPVLVPAERVPLPLGRLAATRVRGDALALDVRSPRGDRAHLEASFSAERVTLLQVVR